MTGLLASTATLACWIVTQGATGASLLCERCGGNAIGSCTQLRRCNSYQGADVGARGKWDSGRSRHDTADADVTQPPSRGGLTVSVRLAILGWFATLAMATATIVWAVSVLA